MPVPTLPPTEGTRYRMQRKLDYWSLNISVSPTARLLGSRSPARGEYQTGLSQAGGRATGRGADVR
jgi:hypothetical protein